MTVYPDPTEDARAVSTIAPSGTTAIQFTTPLKASPADCCSVDIADYLSPKAYSERKQNHTDHGAMGLFSDMRSFPHEQHASPPDLPSTQTLPVDKMAWDHSAGGVSHPQGTNKGAANGPVFGATPDASPAYLPSMHAATSPPTMPPPVMPMLSTPFFDADSPMMLPSMAPNGTTLPCMSPYPKEQGSNLRNFHSDFSLTGGSGLTGHVYQGTDSTSMPNSSPERMTTSPELVDPHGAATGPQSGMMTQFQQQHQQQAKSLNCLMSHLVSTNNGNMENFNGQQQQTPPLSGGCVNQQHVGPMMNQQQPFSNQNFNLQQNQNSFMFSSPGGGAAPVTHAGGAPAQQQQQQQEYNNFANNNAATTNPLQNTVSSYQTTNSSPLLSEMNFGLQDLQRTNDVSVLTANTGATTTSANYNHSGQYNNIMHQEPTNSANSSVMQQTNSLVTLNGWQQINEDNRFESVNSLTNSTFYANNNEPQVETNQYSYSQTNTGAVEWNTYNNQVNDNNNFNNQTYNYAGAGAAAPGFQQPMAPAPGNEDQNSSSDNFYAYDANYSCTAGTNGDAVSGGKNKGDDQQVVEQNQGQYNLHAATGKNFSSSQQQYTSFREHRSGGKMNAKNFRQQQQNNGFGGNKNAGRKGGGFSNNSGGKGSAAIVVLTGGKVFGSSSAAGSYHNGKGKKSNSGAGQHRGSTSPGGGCNYYTSTSANYQMNKPVCTDNHATLGLENFDQVVNGNCYKPSTFGADGGTTSSPAAHQTTSGGYNNYGGYKNRTGVFNMEDDNKENIDPNNSTSEMNGSGCSNEGKFYVPRDTESWGKVQKDVEHMHYTQNLNTNSAKVYIQTLMKTMDKRNPVATTILFRKILEVLRYMQFVDTTRPRRLPPISAPVHLTLLVRCFESMIYGVGGAPYLDASEPSYISQIYEVYRTLQVKNSHATAAMLKAWGLVGNLRQCSIFIDQYRALEKSSKNEIYAFLIYQSALDAALRHNNQELEEKIRRFIHVDAISGVDEYWNRSVKVDPSVPPEHSHPHLYQNQHNGYGDNQQLNSPVATTNNGSQQL
ncbi:unnamed protein product [Amoebophrya sp. A120]|nr:unnamed protein product [Amoebophrya sp. A120]|eukprot:GSA120T00008359001.1